MFLTQKSVFVFHILVKVKLWIVLRLLALKSQVPISKLLGFLEFFANVQCLQKKTAQSAWIMKYSLNNLSRRLFFPMLFFNEDSMYYTCSGASYFITPAIPTLEHTVRTAADYMCSGYNHTLWNAGPEVGTSDSLTKFRPSFDTN